MESFLAIGLMSGTSMDGINAAALKTDGETFIEDIFDIEIPYKTETKQLLKAAERAVHKASGDLANAEIIFLDELCAYLREELNLKHIESELSHLTHFLNVSTCADNLSLTAVISHSTLLHRDAVLTLLEQANLALTNIDLIGYHGQTLYHNPSQKRSIQIGDGKLLAETLKVKVVHGFRANDLAHGGQGAPFAPLYHQVLAQQLKKPVAILNCGGIANVSLILGAGLNDLLGFDTGPGNVLVDRFVRFRTEGRESMDFNGQYGKLGKVNAEVLARLFEKGIKDKDYFHKAPPKSLDSRDLVFIDELQDLTIEDGCRTLEAFTAEAIVRAMNTLPCDPPTHYILAGGGFFNPVMLEEFKSRVYAQFGTDCKIQTADEAGWNSKALEAQMFAYFAVRSLLEKPLSVPKTTGVPKPLTGGILHDPA